MKRIMTLAIVLLGIVAFSVPANALTIELNYEFSGAYSPQSPQPPSWLKADFVQTGAGEVTLTMTAQNLTGAEFIGVWDFNLNPAKNPEALAIDYVSGVTGAVSAKADNFKADGDGYFDISFNFAANAFTDGLTSVYTFTLAGLTVADFNYSSVSGGGAGTYKSAAHVQGIDKPDVPGVDSAGSGWIGPGDGMMVPEPGTIILLGLGLLGLGIVVRKRS